MQSQLNAIEALLGAILKGLQTMTAAMQALTDAVANNTTVEQSAITAFQGIAAQIAAIDDPQATALAQQLTAATAALAAAIPAGTTPAAA